jgi:hypothetical protein
MTALSFYFSILLLIFAPQSAIAILLTYQSIIWENSVVVKEKSGKILRMGYWGVGVLGCGQMKVPGKNVTNLRLNVHRKSILHPMQTHPACSSRPLKSHLGAASPLDRLSENVLRRASGHFSFNHPLTLS